MKHELNPILNIFVYELPKLPRSRKTGTFYFSHTQQLSNIVLDEDDEKKFFFSQSKSSLLFAVHYDQTMSLFKLTSGLATSAVK